MKRVEKREKTREDAGRDGLAVKLTFDFRDKILYNYFVTFFINSRHVLNVSYKRDGVLELNL